MLMTMTMMRTTMTMTVAMRRKLLFSAAHCLG
jgi:hypothetical protein